ncbi:MAG TPA: hypothetical protein VMW01_07785 [Williamwhitmania sp.]|nr:hypothetical protein [Williamwhitmania sp.]
MARYKYIQNGQQWVKAKAHGVHFAILAAVFILIISLTACLKESTYSDTPIISFQNFSLVYGTDQLGNKIWTGTLKINFTDGDGNFGLPDPDSTTLPQYRYNLFLTKYVKQNGIFTAVPDSDLATPLSYTVPYVAPVGNNKAQKGTITIQIQYYSETADTIMYSFYITDLTLNNSNVAETGEIVFPVSSK